VKGQCGRRGVAVLQSEDSSIRGCLRGTVSRVATEGCRYELGDGYERVDDELLAYLRRCLTSVKGPVMQPEIRFLKRSALDGGLPRRDRANDGKTVSAHVVCRCLPTLDVSGALGADTVPCEYRWNTRAILMARLSTGIIAKIGQKWKFQQRGLKDQVFKSSGAAN